MMKDIDDDSVVIASVILISEHGISNIIGDKAGDGGDGVLERDINDGVADEVMA